MLQLRSCAIYRIAVQRYTRWYTTAVHNSGTQWYTRGTLEGTLGGKLEAHYSGTQWYTRGTQWYTAVYSGTLEVH